MAGSTFGHALFHSGFSGASGSIGSSGTSGAHGEDKIYISNFSRDMTTASGSQSITAVGFQPKILLISYGFQTGSAQTGFTIWGISGNKGGFTKVSSGWFYPTDEIYLEYTGSDRQQGSLSSFDSNGFTISWTKFGNPTGLLRAYYVAIG